MTKHRSKPNDYVGTLVIMVVVLLCLAFFLSGLLLGLSR